MGEFVRNPITGEEIKIGVMDRCFFSREELLSLKKRGFRGFYAREFDVAAGRIDSLERMLENPMSLFALPLSCPFKKDMHSLRMNNNGLEHDEVIAHVKGNRGSAYVYNGLECAQKDLKEIYAVLIGERFDEKGRARTIFRCDCCGKPFSVDAKEASELQKKYPFWSQWLKPNLKEV